MKVLIADDHPIFRRGLREVIEKDGRFSVVGEVADGVGAIDAMRALAIGGPVEASLWKSIAWLVGIVLVFAPLSVRAYRRAS
jgi:CheY-like chemotaxis protein